MKKDVHETVKFRDSRKDQTKKIKESTKNEENEMKAGLIVSPFLLVFFFCVMSRKWAQSE